MKLTRKHLMERAGLSEDLAQTKQQIVSAIPALFTDFKDDDDMTFAGIIDGFLIDTLFGGDYDTYEENGGVEMRDKMLQNIANATKTVVDKELKMIG